MPSPAPLSPARPSGVVAAVAALALLAGCGGSTVQMRDEITVGGPASTSADASSAVVPGSDLGLASGPTAVTGSESAAGPTTAGPATPAGGIATAPARAAAGGSAASVPASGFGWDANNVYFGVVTQNDSQQAFAAVGAQGVDPGDSLGQANAVASYINAHGGILGRKLVIKTKDVATIATATNPAQAGSEVCTSFTEDNKVIGVLSLVTLMDYPNFRACLAKRHVTLWSSTLKVSDDTTSGSLAPYFLQTVMTSWTRLAPVLVSRLKAQRYFVPWNVRTGAPGAGPVRVGVLVDSTDAGKRTAALLKKELTKAGYGDSVVFSYVNASDGQSSSVQYFQQNGVTHVIVTDVELTAFQNSAASQAYKPRFGISSYNAPYSNLEASGLTPAGANNGALGVGWAPALDVSERNDAATPGGPACRRIMTAGKQQLSGKRLAQAIALSMCDAMLLTQLGANAGGGFAGPRLLDGLTRTAPTFASATGFSTALGRGSWFIPGSVRDLAWHADCSCMKYASVTTRL